MQITIGRRRFLISVVGIVVMGGCQPQLVGPPPLKAVFRKASVATKGQVVGLGNPDGPQAIRVVQVYVRSANENDE